MDWKEQLEAFGRDPSAENAAALDSLGWLAAPG